MKRNIMKNKINAHLIEIILIFGATSLFSLWASFHEIPVLYAVDSPSAISVSAFLAGYDWSDIVSTCGYYGIGYLFIYAPLFMLHCSPTFIYRFTAVAASLIVGAAAIIPRQILLKHFPEISRVKRVSIAMICGAASICNTFVFSMRNEEPLLLCTWITAWLLIDLFLENKNNIKKEALLIFITVYTSFLHERSLMLMISVIACCVLARILFSKKLVRWWLWCVFFIGYFGSKLLLNIYKSHIWKGIPVNSSATASAISGLSEFAFNTTSIKSMLMIIFGILFTQVSLTCGVILISVIAILYKSASFISKEKRNANYRESVLAIVGISYMIGWLMLVGGQGVTWGLGVVDGLKRVEPVWVYPFKAFTYTRYSGNFVPVIVFLGIILFELEPVYQKRIVWASAITGIFIALFWYIIILPYRKLAPNDYYFFPYTAMESELPGINVHAANVIHVIFLLCLLLLLQYCLKTKMIIYFTVAVVLITNFQRYAIFEYTVKDKQLSSYEWANAGTEFLSTIKDELKAMDSGPVYVLDNGYRKRSPGAYCSYFQYWNYDVDLVHGMPHDDYSDALIFTNIYPTTKLLNGFMRARLDDREFVLCRGSKYIDLLTRHGVKLLPYENK